MSMTHVHMRLKNALGRWAAILAVPFFLVVTALFSFLWNVPLHTLGAPRADVPPVILIADEPGKPVRKADPSWLPGILPLLEHYAATVNNAGHVSFSTQAPPEVEIRLDHLTIGMNGGTAVFRFRTKYGFRLQTSRRLVPRERAIYQWLKDIPPLREKERPEEAR